VQEEFVEDLATVVAVGQDTIKVQIERGGGCKSCTMQGLCFSKSTPVDFTIRSADLSFQPAIGDKVILEISPNSRTLIALLIFLVPVLALVLGYYICQQFWGELLSALGGFILMGISFVGIRYIDRSYGNKLSIRIGRRYENNPE